MREAGVAGVPPIPWPAFARVAGVAAAVAAAALATLAVAHRDALAAALPSVDAALNGTSAVLLVLARNAARRRAYGRHLRLMLAATGTSALFLACYLVRFALTGTHRYPLTDWTRPVYLTILATHTLAAATVPVFAAVALTRAARRRFAAHRRVAKIAFPVWLYVSVTGVVVYLMLYHLAG